MVSLVSNQCKYCNSNNDIWVIKRRTNFYSIAVLLWEWNLIHENPWVNTKLTHILQEPRGSLLAPTLCTTGQDRAAHAHCGVSRYFPPFCSFYLYHRILHLLKGPWKSIWKSRGKAGVCAVTPSNCSRTKGRAELEPMMWNEAGEVSRSWHGKRAKARWKSQLSPSEVIPTFPAQGGVKILCIIYSSSSYLPFLIGNYSNFILYCFLVVHCLVCV